MKELGLWVFFRCSNVSNVGSFKVEEPVFSVKNLREEPMCSGGVAGGKKVLYLKYRWDSRNLSTLPLLFKQSTRRWRNTVKTNWPRIMIAHFPGSFKKM